MRACKSVPGRTCTPRQVGDIGRLGRVRQGEQAGDQEELYVAMMLALPSDYVSGSLGAGGGRLGDWG